MVGLPATEDAIVPNSVFGLLDALLTYCERRYELDIEHPPRASELTALLPLLAERVEDCSTEEVRVLLTRAISVRQSRLSELLDLLQEIDGSV